MGFNPSKQYVGTIGPFKMETGDCSYAEVSTRIVHIPTTLTHVISGFITNDSSTGDTCSGRATSTIGEPSYGLVCFSMSDNTMTETLTYVLYGW